MFIRGPILPSSVVPALTLTTPVAHQIFQRGAVTGDILITGTYAGAGAIEASFNGGAYSTVVASPGGGTYSGTLTGQTPGQGTLTVRLASFPAVTASIATKLGDVYVVSGDSNHEGAATNAVAQAATNGLVAVEFGLDGVWKPAQEATVAVGSFTDYTGSLWPDLNSAFPAGSYFGRLATYIMENTDIPVGFIPGAKGGSTSAAWAGASGLYLEQVERLTAAGCNGHKANLLLIGTNDAAADASADYDDRLTDIVDRWKAATGGKTVVCLMNTAAVEGAHAGSIRTQQQAVITANADALQGPDFDGAWTGDIHYFTVAHINEVALRMWNALNTLFYNV